MLCIYACVYVTYMNVSIYFEFAEFDATKK